MAIFHYTIGERVSRGGGQSSLRSAAYLSRECYHDERTGWTHDFTAKSPTMEASDHIARVGRHAEGSRQEVLFLGLYAPEDAPDWCRGAENIERFWNAAEVAEKRKDAQIAERVIIALPKELTLEQSRWALQDHIREFTRQGRVVQVAIHSPEHDQRNLHAHMQISLRGVDESGFKAEKAREQQERYLYRSQYVEHLRENWARVANRHLERHGHEASLDHRSYQRQGIDREPTLHMGPGDADRERRGQRTEIGDHNRAVQERNARRQEQREHARERAPATAAHDKKHGGAGQEQPEELDRRPLLEERKKLVERSLADRVPSGWRRAELADVARELSPTYDRLIRHSNHLAGEIAKAEKAANHARLFVARAEGTIEDRERDMSALRKLAHRSGIWPDTVITEGERDKARGERGLHKRQIKLGAMIGQKNVVDRRAEMALNDVREAAEREMAARRALADRARAELSEIDAKLDVAARDAPTAGRRPRMRM